MEKFDIAIPELQKLLDDFIEVWGPDDGRTVVLQGDLEKAKSRAGLSDFTVSRLKERLARTEAIFGKDHEYPYTEMTALALELSNERDFEGAIDLQRDVVQFYEDKFPRSYPPALRARKTLHFLKVRSGLREEGLQSLVDLLEEAKKLTLDKENAIVTEIAIEAAWAAGYSKDLVQRNYLLHEITNYLPQEALEAIPYLRYQLENLAIFLGSIGDPTSLSYFETLLQGIERQQGTESDEYFRMSLEKATAASVLGMPDEAIRIFSSALARFESGQVEPDLELQTTIGYDLGRALAESGAFKAARSLLEKLVQNKDFAALSQKTRHNTQAQLVMVYENQNEFALAHELSRKCANECQSKGETKTENYLWFKLHEFRNASVSCKPQELKDLLTQSEAVLGKFETTTLHIYGDYARRLGIRQFARALDAYDAAHARWASLTGPGSNGALENRIQCSELLRDHGDEKRALKTIYEAMEDCNGKQISPWIEMRGLKLLLELAAASDKSELIMEYAQRLELLRAKYETELQA
jgi:hypothetical protein